MIKNIVFSFVILIVVIAVSCDNDSNDQTIATPYDHEAQIPIDREALIVYLSTHYYNTNDGFIWTIGNEEAGSLPLEDQIALINDENLDSIEGIDPVDIETISTYTMYYYIEEEGIDNGNVGYTSPSPVDSVFVRYSGMLLDSTVFDSRWDFPIWFQLPNNVEGWRRGLPKFKRGTFQTTGDEDFIFENPGLGYIFFPSGLGYRDRAQISIPANSNLVFRVELDDVKLIDTDLDLVPTKFELSIDAAGNITTYNSDEDSLFDFQDVDDDNDFTLTKDEVLDEFTTLDARGNIDFPYGADGNIAAKGSVTPENPNGDTPNYKNPDKHLED